MGRKLAAITDAGRFVRYLRGPGGLDEYFGEHERASHRAKALRELAVRTR